MYRIMHIPRRTFLKNTSLATAALGLGLPALTACSAGEPSQQKLPHFGLITGWMGEVWEKDWEGTLEKIAAAGYTELEFGKGHGPSPEVFLQKVRSLGLKPVAGGASMAQFTSSLSELIDQRLAMGQQYLVCYWPWMDSGKDRSIDLVKSISESFNRFGETCKQNGLTFAFHNHDKEFLPIDGQIPYDILLTETDPELVTMEIDLYWIRKGGGEVLDYFRRYPGRFELCHVKDMDATAEKGFAAPGEGIIDFGAIFQHREAAGLKHFFVEQDKAPEPIRSMEVAAAYLKALTF